MTKELPETGLGRHAIQQMLKEARGADLDLRHKKWHERAFLYSFHLDDEVGEVAEDAYLKFAKTRHPRAIGISQRPDAPG